MGVMRFDLVTGDTLSIDGGRVKLTMEQKSGSRARLKIQADDSIVISLEGEKQQQPQRTFRRPATT